MAASALIGLVEPLRKIWQDLYGLYKKNSSHYLEGRLTSGLDGGAKGTSLLYCFKPYSLL